MDNYKTTPEQWAAVQVCSAAHPGAWGDCILELRSRVEALEAQVGNLKGSLTSSTPPPVATDEELRDTWYCHGHHYQARRAIYNLGVAHGKAGSREVAEPVPVAWGLVERAANAIRRALETLPE